MYFTNEVKHTTHFCLKIYVFYQLSYHLLIVLFQVPTRLIEEPDEGEERKGDKEASKREHPHAWELAQFPALVRQQDGTVPVSGRPNCYHVP